LTWAAGLGAVALFVVLAHQLGIRSLGAHLAATRRQATLDLRNPALDDTAKERAMRAHATTFGRMALRTAALGLAAACGALLLPGSLAALGWLDGTALIELSTTPIFLLAAAVLGGSLAKLWPRRR
jgi:hypothetical protein